jgi:hypothetical protein
MTSARNGSPTRALVLGGGGAVGVGWQTGLLIGLDEAGVDLAGADTIVGTSAGAFVGALLASGRDVSQALTSLAALGQGIGSGRLAAGDEAFLPTPDRWRLLKRCLQDDDLSDDGRAAGAMVLLYGTNRAEIVQFTTAHLGSRRAGFFLGSLRPATQLGHHGQAPQTTRHSDPAGA